MPERFPCEILYTDVTYAPGFFVEHPAGDPNSKAEEPSGIPNVYSACISVYWEDGVPFCYLGRFTEKEMRAYGDANHFTLQEKGFFKSTYRLNDFGNHTLKVSNRYNGLLAHYTVSPLSAKPARW